MKFTMICYFGGNRFEFVEGQPVSIQSWTHTKPYTAQSTNLPTVLLANDKNSLSMERALKQIKTLLEDYASMVQQQNAVISLSAAEASIDYVETMLASIR